MRKEFILFGIFCLLSISIPAFAEGDIESRIRTLEDMLKKQEETVKEQQTMINELKAQIKKDEVKQTNASSQPENSAAGQTAPASETQQLVQELKEKVDQISEAQKKVLPSEFNPSIGLVGETIFSYRDKGSSQTGSARPGGFDVYQRSVELNAAAAVDPFAKAYVVINASADPVTGESSLGVEEAALQTTSLPWNLEMKAGRFFGEFGRLGYIHDHELPFVNRPLALDEYIGGESRTDGLQINWLLPVDHYVSLTVGAGDQFGGDNPPNNAGDFRNGSGLNYWGRLSTYFDLTPDISLEPGISALWNPSTDAQWAEPGSVNPPLPTVAGNTYTERERRLWGADLMLSYKPLRNNQFESVVWGTEVLFSDNRYDVTDSLGNALSGTSVGSVGLYSYLTYKFHRQWSVGGMFEYVENEVNNQDKTYAYSLYTTWALSHWNQLRLQYTYTDPNAASGRSSDNAVYLQWAWIIGSHSHGWQQR
ncbi:MAG TPA: hypothetical protein VMU29_13990 [Smithella sp.]|nr:hypothetical protein [Smithella sp.]